MKITVLYVEDCPNLEPVMEQLNQIIKNKGCTCEVEAVLVTSEVKAQELGFHGSPTILINGQDPFPHEENASGLTCRRYKNHNSDGNHISGFPSMEDLEKVIPDHAFA